MKGRLETQLQKEKEIERRIAEEMPVLWPFYFSTEHMTAVSRYGLICNIIRFCKYCQNTFHIPCEKEADFQQVTVDHLNQYLHVISRKANGTGTLAPGSVCLIMSHLTSYFNYLEDKGIIDRNPTKNMMKRPRIPKKEQVVYLEPEEIQQMYYNIDHCQGDFKNSKARQKWKSRDKAFITLMLITGVRINAVVEANIEDLSVDEQTIILTDKGNKSRTYYIDDDAMLIMNTWLRRREVILKELRTQSDILFFSIVNNKVQRVVSNTMTHMIANYTAFTGKRITGHKLHSTLGTMVYRETHDIYKVAEVLNHSKVSTSQIYAQQDASTRTDASKMMTGIITGKK